jgi:type IV fimbrial biogenesis protein FimT
MTLFFSGEALMSVRMQRIGIAIRRGFTLVEMLIGISIVAILAALALPSFRQMSINMSVNSNTNEIVGALNVARAEAVKRGVDVVLRTNGPNWSSGWTVTPDLVPEALQTHAAYADNYRVLGMNTGGGSITRVVFGSTGSLVGATAFDFSVCRPTTSPGNADSRWIHVAASGMITSRRDSSSSPAGGC